MKPRLKGLRPPSPPARTAQNQPPPDEMPRRGASLQPATAGFVAERADQARPLRRGFNRLRSAAVAFPRILEKSIMAEERIPYDISPLLPLQD